MKASCYNKDVILKDKPYKKRILIEDVNFPCKFTIDRKNNSLFFCINADEFSDQSFQSVILNLDTGLASVIPGIRNGFASAVDQVTSNVYLGGSDGIFKYNYDINDIDQHLIEGLDIFDMYFKDKLYFVVTTDKNGEPYFVAKDGIYEIDKSCKHLSKVLSLENGLGLSYDKDNNIVYSEERHVATLVPF